MASSTLGPLTVLAAGFACLLLLSFLSVVRKALFTELRRIPGPRLAAWTVLPLKLQVLRGQRSQYIHALHQTYGPFVRISPTEVAIADLDAFRAIHKVGSGFNKSEWYMKFTDSPQPGIFAMTDPKQHATRRRLFAQAFSNTSVLKFENLIREKTEIATAKIERDARHGNADILKWFTFMATDITGELSFGTSFDMLQHEEKTQYVRDLETTMMISGMRSELGFLFKVASYLPLPFLRQASQLRTRLDAYGARAIGNHKAFVCSHPGSDETSLFARFLDPKKNQELSEAELAEEASNLIVAGSDTTAVSLTYLVWSMLRPQHRRALDKLLAEIAPIPLGTSANGLKDLKYLNAVVDETLRLYGAAPGSQPRVVPARGALFSGYSLPGGATVSTQAFTLHRDARIFESPEEFKPERWESPTQEMRDAFAPFGAGSRICVGIHLAMLELVVGAFYFFKRCPNAQLASTMSEDCMDFENYFLISPKGHKCEVTLC